MDQLSRDELEIFKELFDAVSPDLDGSITYKELEVVFKALGGSPSESQLQDMINEADTDGNGCIEIEEFVEVLLRKLTLETNQDELRDAFFIFDKDRNGFIAGGELRTIYIALGLKISDEEIDDMIRVADADQDGVVTLDEFYTMMSSE